MMFSMKESTIVYATGSLSAVLTLIAIIVCGHWTQTSGIHGSGSEVILSLNVVFGVVDCWVLIFSIVVFTRQEQSFFHYRPQQKLALASVGVVLLSAAITTGATVGLACKRLRNLHSLDYSFIRSQLCAWISLWVLSVVSQATFFGLVLHYRHGLVVQQEERSQIYPSACDDATIRSISSSMLKLHRSHEDASGVHPCVRVRQNVPGRLDNIYLKKRCSSDPQRRLNCLPTFLQMKATTGSPDRRSETSSLTSRASQPARPLDPSSPSDIGREMHLALGLQANRKNSCDDDNHRPQSPELPMSPLRSQSRFSAPSHRERVGSLLRPDQEQDIHPLFRTTSPSPPPTPSPGTSITVRSTPPPPAPPPTPSRIDSAHGGRHHRMNPSGSKSPSPPPSPYPRTSSSLEGGKTSPILEEDEESPKSATDQEDTAGRDQLAIPGFVMTAGTRRSWNDYRRRMTSA